MKTCFVIAYFGKLPNYFDIFLKSCEFNKDFNWIIFTDDETEYKYPNNVQCININFAELKKLVQSRFDFQISLSNPQKLCDYKCAFGYIFSEYLKEYDFWGHCDLDQVFGDLKSFITADMLQQYDKLFSLGHLTLYRNRENINKIFMTPLNGVERYKEVFTTNLGCAFDEWYPKSINDIFIQEKIPFLLDSICADVNPYTSSFVLDFFDYKQRKYFKDKIKHSLFLWDEGKVFQLYIQDGKLGTKEFAYVHLQKRKMKNRIDNLNQGRFYIAPNEFINFNRSKEMKYVNKYRIKCLFLFQYLKVKYKSLKYRIKSKNWDMNPRV